MAWKYGISAAEYPNGPWPSSAPLMTWTFSGGMPVEAVLVDIPSRRASSGAAKGSVPGVIPAHK
ncbi:hypothetical protein D3C76_1602280 [compost metagenome]